MSDQEHSEKKFIPTMSGTTVAYKPEYREGAWVKGQMLWTDWEEIHIVDGKGIFGVPYPALCGGVFKTLGFYGYEQAHALAWQFSAQAAAEPRRVETRIAVYEFIYDLKARRLEKEEISLTEERRELPKDKP